MSEVSRCPEASLPPFLAPYLPSQVVCWGDEQYGGNCTGLDLSSSVAVYASWEAFAALQPDGTLLCWGAAGPSPATHAILIQLKAGDLI